MIWSLHPTHSMAGVGRDAAAYLKAEELCNTPCTPGGCYDRLKECGGKILLVGVGHERNTYIHSAEEVLNVPNRLSDRPMKLQIVMPDALDMKVLAMEVMPDHIHLLVDCRPQLRLSYAVKILKEL